MDSTGEWTEHYRHWLKKVISTLQHLTNNVLLLLIVRYKYNPGYYGYSTINRKYVNVLQFYRRPARPLVSDPRSKPPINTRI